MINIINISLFQAFLALQSPAPRDYAQILEIGWNRDNVDNVNYVNSRVSFWKILKTQGMLNC